MLENIALIKEANHSVSVKDASKEALLMLERLSLENIAQKRVTYCSKIDIFYVMFIRALMSDAKNIVIVTPFSLVKNLENITQIIENILLLNDDKNIIILDNISNETHYKGYPCHIIK